jgi:hypothetical protein
MVAAGMVAAAAIGGIASYASAGEAADAQTAGANMAIRQLQPYNQAGVGALNQLSSLTSGNPQAALEQLPGYQFTLSQGLKSVQNSAAARGLGVSGAAQKGAASYATGLADSTFGNQFNRLMSLASLGENAAAGVGNNAVGAGNAQAAAANAQGAAVSGTANQVGGIFGTDAILKNMGGSGLFGSSGGAASTSLGGGYYSTLNNPGTAGIQWM